MGVKIRFTKDDNVTELFRIEDGLPPRVGNIIWKYDDELRVTNVFWNYTKCEEQYVLISLSPFSFKDKCPSCDKPYSGIECMECGFINTMP